MPFLFFFWLGLHVVTFFMARAGTDNRGANGQPHIVLFVILYCIEATVALGVFQSVCVLHKKCSLQTKCRYDTAEVLR